MGQKARLTHRPTRPGLCSLLLAAASLAQICQAAPEVPDGGQDARPLAPTPQAPAQPAASQTVLVVTTTALAGLGMPLNQVSGNVQVIGGAGLRGAEGSGLAASLDQRGGSISLNDTAGNAYQPDVSFRGLVASPALGTPQGLSVFVDGVRVNEVFGDTVNWDLIPAVAIGKITVIPGSNPVFGLNTLGGALNVSTRSGRTDPGSSLELSGGAWGREALEFSSGGASERADWFVGSNLIKEHGWAEHNPSRIRQGFGRLGLREGGTEAALSLTLADTRLEGSQTLPMSWLGQPRQAYSWPDYQTNRLAFANFKLSRELSATELLEANLYWRQLRTDSLNSNVNDDFDPALPMGPGNQATGNAILAVKQARPGAALQWSSLAPLFGRSNHAVLGGSIDSGHTDFQQSDQEAGSSRDTTSKEPILLATSLKASARAAGLFASDTLGLSERTFLTVSARENRARVDLADQLGTALNGHHTFRRLNPAVGLAHNPAPELTVYAAYNEGMRVPTPVELGCADPEAPCALPNAFVSDPALKPVISRTLEFGARGSAASGLRWSAAVFHTALNDDIQFISAGGGASNTGYFQNVGRTLRRGVELGLDGKPSQGLELSLRYSVVAATFESPFLMNSPNNSTAAPLSCDSCADIAVRPGDRLPGVPRQTLKLHGDLSLAPGLTAGLRLRAQSWQVARGDENNRDARGPVPGFALIDLDAQWRYAPGWEAWLRVENLLNRRSQSFGALGRNVFTGPGNTFDATGVSWRSEQFRTVGAPRAAWLGVSTRF